MRRIYRLWACYEMQDPEYRLPRRMAREAFSNLFDRKVEEVAASKFKKSGHRPDDFDFDFDEAWSLATDEVAREAGVRLY